jgi:hypothetical protein
VLKTLKWNRRTKGKINKNVDETVDNNSGRRREGAKRIGNSMLKLINGGRESQKRGRENREANLLVLHIKRKG